MPRTNHNGTPAQPPLKKKLNDTLIKNITPQHKAFLVWDTQQRGLAVYVQPTGHKAFKCIYRQHRKPRWYHIANVGDFGVAQARNMAMDVMYAVRNGKDPVAERVAERSKGTFKELADRYVKEYAKKNNKSWKRADHLVQKHLCGKWGNLPAAAITRADVKAIMHGMDATPPQANLVKACASAIFKWAIKEGVLKANPCQLIDDNALGSRERVLSASEVPVFWQAFDATNDLLRSTALKTVLLTGQRPGEVRHMRREHIVDGWWQMPGKPVPALGWPGTKNGKDHRVWLPAAVQALLTDLDPDAKIGFVFASTRGGALGKLDSTMRDICTTLGVTDPAKPHDLRRTHGTMITRLGFGRDAMNRVQNHTEGGIADVYDRHSYEDENKQIMETVAARLLALVNGETGKVLNFRAG